MVMVVRVMVVVVEVVVVEWCVGGGADGGRRAWETIVLVQLKVIWECGVTVRISYDTPPMKCSLISLTGLR